MSVSSSVINTQSVSIDSLICPQGRALATSPNLVAEKSKLAYNLTDNKVYVCTGSVWSDIGGTSNVTLAAIGAVPNANGASIDASQVLTLEPASASFGGVVTTGAQTFGGTKTFSAIVAPGTNYAIVAPINAIDANGITINNVTNQIAIEVADATHSGMVTIAPQTFGGTKTFSAIVAPGTNYAAIAPIVASDAPFNKYFDASMVWGPIYGRMLYAGLRFKIK